MARNVRGERREVLHVTSHRTCTAAVLSENGAPRRAGNKGQPRDNSRPGVPHLISSNRSKITPRFNLPLPLERSIMRNRDTGFATLRRVGGALVAIGLLSPLSAAAQKSGRSSTRHFSSSTRSRRTSTKPRSTSTHSRKPSVPKKSTGAKRERNGRIKRSSSVHKPSSCGGLATRKAVKGYVVHHIIPLECGGADDASNMQWQTVHEANVKDRTERNCRRE